jgi:hypothetical protein
MKKEKSNKSCKEVVTADKEKTKSAFEKDTIPSLAQEKQKEHFKASPTDNFLITVVCLLFLLVWVLNLHHIFSFHEEMLCLLLLLRYFSSLPVLFRSNQH